MTAQGFKLSEYVDADGKATKYAWPGGYPVYYVTSDGAALCPDCVTKERAQITESIADNSNDGWQVVGADVNYEDASLYCDNCNKRIESAYAEDEATKDAE
jgi:hypothetical protein